MELSFLSHYLVRIPEYCLQDIDKASQVVKVNTVISDMGCHLVKGMVFLMGDCIIELRLVVWIQDSFQTQLCNEEVELLPIPLIFFRVWNSEVPPIGGSGGIGSSKSSS